LLLFCDCRVILLVLTRASPYIGLSEHVDFAIRSVEENPLTDIEFSLVVKEGSLDELLEDKGKILVLLVFGHITGHVFSMVMIVVVRLEDRRFVSLTASDAVVVAHYIP
jgi:hypothetical protein